jgi:aspartate racemase
MPDRSRAIHDRNDGPLPFLVDGVAYLAAQGVGLIAIPCSTSHFWFGAMQAASSVPILHIADAALEELERKESRRPGPVAVLATRGTHQSGIYRDRLVFAGYDVFALSEPDQVAVDTAIAGVKRGEIGLARQQMETVEASLAAHGVKAVILGCTELPLAWEKTSDRMASIDTTAALAASCLRRLGYRLQEDATPRR